MSKGHVFHSCIYYFFNAQIAKVYAYLIKYNTDITA